LIYIYNSNVKFKKQIEYVFMNIFYVLGLNYTILEGNQMYMLKPEDILFLYVDDEVLKNFVDNSKNIIILKFSDKLFSDNYLNVTSMPKKIKKYNEIISIYSEDKDLYIKKVFNNKKIIETNIDIISDIFFMLTRYEEVINNGIYKREKYNRFPASESIAVKRNFLHRPIVNEHIDLLWSFIDSFNLGYKKKMWWGGKDFAACLTYDVDIIQKYKKRRDVIKSSGNLLLVQKKPIFAINHFFNYFILNKKDPFDTFDYIINLEKSYNFKASFYFMTGGNSEFDNSYDINDQKVKKLIEEISEEGFEIGYHCSFNSYSNINMLKEEKEKLDFILGKKYFGCRQHFLRFQVPYSWENQEQAGLLYDTTLGFADMEGFRCGTCFPFKPYDLLLNRVLDIWEIPLIVMGESMQNPIYRAYTPQQGLQKTKDLINIIKRYNGVFTMLYHNSSFDPFNKMLYGWKDTYEQTMDYLYNNNCLGTSGREIISIITK
jgi:peptidoglycan/xylan/chitin deacetylase (PgdA/CDA1 family)